jgi:hypothetical protein
MGERVANVLIEFYIIEQPAGVSAAFSADSVTTNANREASVTLTLGDILGEYQVKARSPSDHSPTPLDKIDGCVY